MLAFISDIHLADGTSGETIHSGAFRKFALYLKDMVETAEAKELEIVLLGDIFDVIRSNYWLRSGIRPWSDTRAKDGEGKGVKDYTIQIVNKICRNRVNKESVAYLKDFREQVARKGVALLSRQVLAESGSNILKDDDPSQLHFMKSIVLLLVVLFITPVPFYVFLGGLAKVDFLWGWQDNIHDTQSGQLPLALFSCSTWDQHTSAS